MAEEKNTSWIATARVLSADVLLAYADAPEAVTLYGPVEPTKIG